jgi:hypothetical protein
LAKNIKIVIVISVIVYVLRQNCRAARWWRVKKIINIFNIYLVFHSRYRVDCCNVIVRIKGFRILTATQEEIFTSDEYCEMSQRQLGCIPFFLVTYQSDIIYRVFKFLLQVGVEESIVNTPLVSLQSKNTNNGKSVVSFKRANPWHVIRGAFTIDSSTREF